MSLFIQLGKGHPYFRFVLGVNPRIPPGENIKLYCTLNETPYVVIYL
jgi:hypothetical protein